MGAGIAGNNTSGQGLALVRCYTEGGGSNPPATVVYNNDDNETDLSFSLGERTPPALDEMKLETSADPLEPDALAAMQAIADCIDEGNIARMTWVDADGASYGFDAEGYTGAPGGPMLLQGDITGGSGAGKVGLTLTVECVGEFTGAGEEREALRCKDGKNLWVDLITDVPLTEDEIATLQTDKVAKALADLKECLMIEKDDDTGGDDTDDGDADGFTPLYPAANGKIVSDNFQDGNGNAPFNLQVRNTTGNAVNWQACTPPVPYEEIPNLTTPLGVAYEVVDNGDGTYLHCFSGQNLGAFQNVIITGGLPSPAGSGGANNLSLYCEAA